jgi:hypothetical protein
MRMRKPVDHPQYCYHALSAQTNGCHLPALREHLGGAVGRHALPPDLRSPETDGAILRSHAGRCSDSGTAREPQ